MNKKGQTDLIGNILSLIPKPVIFLMFIGLLVVIGYLISPVFNAFGVFCDSSGDVVKIPNSDLFSNIAISSKLKESSDPSESVLFFFDTGCTIFYDGQSRFLDNGCTTCDTFPRNEVYPNWWDGINQDDVCVGDAFRTPRENLSWYARAVKCPFIDCTIPNGYYYESDTNTFECFNNLCDVSEGVYRDNKLAEFGAIPMYKDESDRSITGVFRYTCSKGLRVEPSIAGIPFLNVTFWGIILLLILMVWAIIHIKKK